MAPLILGSVQITAHTSLAVASCGVVGVVGGLWSLLGTPSNIHEVSPANNFPACRTFHWLEVDGTLRVLCSTCPKPATQRRREGSPRVRQMRQDSCSGFRGIDRGGVGKQSITQSSRRFCGPLCWRRSHRPALLPLRHERYAAGARAREMYDVLHNIRRATNVRHRHYASSSVNREGGQHLVICHRGGSDPPNRLAVRSGARKALQAGLRQQLHRG